MAFASKCYLESSNSPNDLIRVFNSEIGDQPDQRFTYTAFDIRQMDQTRLPLSVTFRAQSKEDKTTPAIIDAIYTAFDRTNISGGQLPLRAELNVYSLMEQTSLKDNERYPVITYQIVVSDINFSSSTKTFQPDIRTNTFVVDHRTGPQGFNFPRPLHYKTDKWLTLDEVKRTWEYSRELKTDQGRPSSSPNKLGAKVIHKRLLMVFFILSPAPIIGIFYRNAADKKRKNNAER
jgi:hypothetical protein